jgi:membrane protein involved in D-alanine export
MRDHVYMRFVLHAARRKWFGGNRHIASNVGLMLTMGLMGLWHGLAWHYIAYGIYQGTMLVAYDLIGRRLPREGFAASRVARVASIVLTFNLFCFGLLIFSGHLFQ